MANIKKFKVIPYLPDKLKPLLKIVYNLWWVWNYEAIELFRRLDVDLWREVGHNPIKLLGSISQGSLEKAAESESFIAHMERVEEALDWHLNRKTWYSENREDFEDAGIAYFSAEFGIHECLSIYSGGLGVLSGDHLKSASELGIPLIGVGLLYKHGYFRQYLNYDGWQQERYPEIDFHNIPIKLVCDENKDPIIIDVDYPGRKVFAQIWQVRIGTIRLYLLDANINKNSYDDKTITDQLYGGDHEMRIKQEIMLGIGGVRALRALKKNISVYHMNEGHAAFLSIERMIMAMEENKLSFKDALEFVSATNVFTTHTPVPAGNDRFDVEILDPYLSYYYGKLKLPREKFLAFGRENPSDKKETFCMTVLALKTAAYANGVSKLHGSVSRKMWKNIWSKLPVHEVPIGHITNGIQTMSWTSDEMMRLFNRYLGPNWIDNPGDNTIWENIDDIPDSELWRCRERLRERLVSFARKTLRKQLLARGVSPKEAEVANSVLDTEALTIGFARRFATYKRATLLFKDMDKLSEILLNKDRPVQLIFAGKAHPKDNMGKELIQEIISLSSDVQFRNKVVFLEDYDINIARYLVQGVDVWLNNPIRPKEASGTSGMKVVPNGGLNISVLDGWWDEAYNSENGWAIGMGEVYDDPIYQDEVESRSLYNMLKEDVVSAFYSRRLDGIPGEWVAKMKESMRTNCSVFTTNRMVKDYSEMYYRKAHKNYVKYTTENFKITKEISKWKDNITKKFDAISIVDMKFSEEEEIKVGSKINVKTEVYLGELTPEDVRVELYFGNVNEMDQIIEGVALPMTMVQQNDKGHFIYDGQLLCLRSGEFAFTIRIIPYNINMVRVFDPKLTIKWY